MAELKLQAVSKLFEQHPVVDNLNLTIPSGSFTALLGPSGCGKSTTLRLLAGLEKVSSGRIALGSRVLADNDLHVPAEARNMGMVFQSYALWPHMTVAENVGYPLKLKKTPAAVLKKKVAEALEMVEMNAFADRAPQALSGGQRQRVALARCLVSEPEVVLLDEPLANLDRHLRATMEQSFREFHQRTGATCIYVTHDQAEAMALADHIAVMQQGRVMQWGAPHQLYQQPENAWVAQFIGRGSLLQMATNSLTDLLTPAELHQGLTSANRAHRHQVLLRPEHVRVSDSGLAAQVESCIYQGERYLLQLRLADGQSLTAYHTQNLAPAQPIQVQLLQGWRLSA